MHDIYLFIFDRFLIIDTIKRTVLAFKSQRHKQKFAICARFFLLLLYYFTTNCDSFKQTVIINVANLFSVKYFLFIFALELSF